MNDLNELYQDLIIDHGRHPRHYGQLAHTTHQHEGYNPLCGDQMIIYLCEEGGMIKDVSFEGKGCAISMASTSLMLEAIKGKTLHEVREYFHNFLKLVTGKATGFNLGKLAALKGVSAFPVRVKCATLCWHTLLAAMEQHTGTITTE